MYKPDESHILKYENIDFSNYIKEEFEKHLEDVQWMLQTESYRTHYLARLENIENLISNKINKN